MKISIFSILFFVALSGHANEHPLLALLNQKQSDIMIKQTAIDDGSDRAPFCTICHGINGNSNNNDIPNLADQNPAYLIKQFELFSTGERNNKTMYEMAKILNDEEKVNIALYFSSQNAKPQVPYKPELWSTGKHLYDTKCFMCHGKDGHGIGEFPRIASQKSEYIIKTLNSYQSTPLKRQKSAMSGVASTLKKEEIEALASYLTVLE